MSADLVDGPEFARWRAARREALAPAGFAARVLSALPPHPRAVGNRARVPWWRAAAVAAGSAWFLVRLASLFLPFTVF